MKLAFSSNAFTKYSLNESVDEISKIGYKGIEIMCDVPHAFPPQFDDNKISELKRELEKNKLQISNLNAFTLFGINDTYHPSWIEDDPDYRENRIKHTINCLKLASRLGANNISVEPGGPVYNTSMKKDYLNLFLKGLNKVIPSAEEEKIKILVEPEPGLLLETSDEFLQFIKNFDSEFIGLNFDIGHFFCVKEDPSEVVYKLREYLGHVHLADIKNRTHNHLIPGLGDIDFIRVFRSLADIGYDGFITVELYPYKENPKEAATRSYKYLTNILSNL